MPNPKGRELGYFRSDSMHFDLLSPHCYIIRLSWLLIFVYKTISSSRNSSWKLGTDASTFCVISWTSFDMGHSVFGDNYFESGT